MATEDKNSGFSENNSDNSRNNNGTIGGAGGVEKESKKGSLHEMNERARVPEANERGIRENEENHMLGDQKYEGGAYAKNEIDPNKPGNQNSEGKNIKYPKEGYNHIDNPGGTAEEDMERNN